MGGDDIGALLLPVDQQNLGTGPGQQHRRGRPGAAGTDNDNIIAVFEGGQYCLNITSNIQLRVRPITKFADQIVANIAECMLADTAIAAGTSGRR